MKEDSTGRSRTRLRMSSRPAAEIVLRRWSDDRPIRILWGQMRDRRRTGVADINAAGASMVNAQA